MLGLKLNHVSKRGHWYRTKSPQLIEARTTFYFGSVPAVQIILDYMSWYYQAIPNNVRHIHCWVRKRGVHTYVPSNGEICDSSALTHWGRDKIVAMCADDSFFLENRYILIRISLKSVPKNPINNIPALVQIMAWVVQMTSHYPN